MYYAKQGYDVTAIELVEENIVKTKTRNNRKNEHTSTSRKCVDLSMFKDETFDITLVLGPMYHLFTKEEQEKQLQKPFALLKKEDLSILHILQMMQ